VESGKFRQDLYYRLAVIELKMPPLRDCREDIPVLADAILRRLSGPDGKRSIRLSEEAKKALAGYDFPGNTRELENILERAIALAALEEIQPDDLQLAPPTSVAHEPGAPNAKWPLPEYLDRIEREAILEALEKTRFNRTAAAKLLGITFRALRYRMERLGIR
ncbi:MAG: sigma-54-dependent Fis family transcriptional regulator, partial [Betaproteobacteria bacterium]